MRALFEWKSCKPITKIINTKRLIRGSDVQLQISPRPPDQRGESQSLRSGPQELINNTDNVFAGDFVSITLWPITFEGSRSIAQTNCALRATGHRQPWIFVTDVGRVQQRRDIRCR